MSDASTELSMTFSIDVALALSQESGIVILILADIFTAKCLWALSLGGGCITLSQALSL